MTLKVVRRKDGDQIEFRIPDHAENPAMVLVISRFSSGAAIRQAVNKWALPYGAALED